MKQIIKRLELIKTAIDIDDEEIIELQVLKLQKLGIDDNVKTILEKLENMNYAKAVQKIEDYLVKYSGVVEYVDSEVQGLKLELKAIESKLQELIEQKIECLNDIEEFNREYNLHLGEIIKDILNLKKEILYKKTIKQQQAKEKHEEERQTCKDIKETIDELKATMVELEDALENIDEDDENYVELTKAYDELKEELIKLEDELEFQEEELEKTKEFIEDETVEQEYEEVKSHYEEFEDEYKQIKESFENSVTLNDEEKQELKSFYKKAARLCHPDIVPDELKEKAHELMQKLNDAYSQKDISQVKEILHSLQNGTSFEVSSETIENKELLKAKIKEYLKNIEALKSELEEIKEDEIYQTIDKLDDWDEYFEELRDSLEKEKVQLEEEAREILVEIKEEQTVNIESDKKEKNIPKWMQKLWNWADENKISSSKLPKNKDKLLKKDSIDFTGLGLNNIPNEICNLDHVTTMVFWDNNLRFLPENITNFTQLEKLNLRGNPHLSISESQQKWIDSLKYNRCNVFIDDVNVVNDEEYIKLKNFNLSIDEQKLLQIIEEWIVVEFNYLYKKDITQYPKAYLRVKSEANRVAQILMKKGVTTISLKYLLEGKHFIKDNITLDMFIGDSNETYPNITKIHEKEKPKIQKIKKENSNYSKGILAIEQPTFEKVRRYCSNLRDNDVLSTYLSENGKMHKALIYSALEEFLEDLEGESLTLIDWGCGQGISSMLVLDYVKEKQLDIKVSQVMLVNKDKKSLSRAMLHVETFKEDTSNIEAFHVKGGKLQNTFNIDKSTITLNIFANDYIPIDFKDIDMNIFEKVYFVCLSNKDKNFVDEVYNDINLFSNCQNVSIKNGKIGKFKKFEKIFKILL